MSPFSFPRRQPRASTSTPALGSLFGSHADIDALADMKAAALDMIQTITSMAADVADTLPFPGLKVGLLALAEVVKKLQVCGYRSMESSCAEACRKDHADKCRGRGDASTAHRLSCSEHS